MMILQEKAVEETKLFDQPFEQPKSPSLKHNRSRRNSVQVTSSLF